MSDLNCIIAVRSSLFQQPTGIIHIQAETVFMQDNFGATLRVLQNEVGQGEKIARRVKCCTLHFCFSASSFRS